MLGWFLVGFISGIVLGGMFVYESVKEYRRELGLKPDPFDETILRVFTADEVEEILKKEKLKMISEIKRWAKGKNVDKEKLRNYLNNIK